MSYPVDQRMDPDEWRELPVALSHDDVAEIAFNVINTCHSEGIHDSLRQAHAIAVAIKLAEENR